jgi:hypothetical protein
MKPSKCPNEADMGRAHRLRDAVVNRLRIYAKWKPTSWGTALKLLLEDLNNDSDRLDRVLNYYCQHIDDRYCPWAWSAKTFRAKFALIEAWMKRRQEHQPDAVPVSQESKDILSDLYPLGWGSTSESQLPSTVQASLDNLKKALSTRMPPSVSDVFSEFRRQVGEDVDYLVKWFRNVHRRWSRYDGWDGSMGRHVWKPRHPQVVRALEKAVQGYHGYADSKLVEKILTILESATEGGSL